MMQPTPLRTWNTRFSNITVPLYVKKISWTMIGYSLFIVDTFADLPTPPSDDLPSGNKSWIDIGGTLAFKVLNLALIIGAAAGCLAAIGGFIQAYHTSQEKQDLSHFAKYGFLSVFLLVVCGAIAYYGTTQVIKAATN